MKQNDITSLFTDPLFMQGIGRINPQEGQRLQDLALQQRQHQESQRQQQEFELKQQEAIRQQTLAKSLPQALQGIDFSDPNTAYQQLVQVGLKPQEALPIIAQFANINAGKEQSELNKQRFGLEEKEYGLKEQELGLKRAKNAFDMSGIASPEEKIKIEKELRAELKDSKKAYEHVSESFNNIKQLAKDKSGSSDMGMIYAYVKLLDPQSTVGVGEKISAEHAPGLPQATIGYLNSLLSQGSLSSKGRADLIRSSKTLYDTNKSKYKNNIKESTELAKRYNVNPANVVLNEAEDEEETPLVDNTNEFGGKQSYSNPDIENELIGRGIDPSTIGLQ